MDIIYQAADEDFNFFKAQLRKLDAERNESILTSIFRTITGIRHKTRRRQVTGIPPKPITLGLASPTMNPSLAIIPGMPVTITTPAQEALAATTVLDTPAMAPEATEMEHMLSIPETVMAVHPSTNQSQLGAYLNNCVHQVTQNTNVSICSSDSYTQENLKSLLNEKLNDNIYSTFKETFFNTNLDSVNELSPKV